LDALMPSGSITGAPKVAAMDLIAELEAHRRGLYTGALGYLTHGGGMKLSMAIRVLSVSGAEAHYFSGGGIVADSDPQRELEETLWKAQQLRSLVRI
jgi:anthranilate/para-aminobenzoate synthase component I